MRPAERLITDGTAHHEAVRKLFALIEPVKVSETAVADIAMLSGVPEAHVRAMIWVGNIVRYGDQYFMAGTTPSATA